MQLEQSGGNVCWGTVHQHGC